MNLKDKTIVIDNKTYRYSKIVILPSLNFSKIGKFKDTGNLVFNNSDLDIPRGEFQHLYFLSTDKICEGDWYCNLKGLYNNSTPTISLCKDNTDTSFRNSIPDIYKKIISSTDSSINLPKPSDSFLQVYVDAYNKNEKIEECLVEYIDFCDYEGEELWEIISDYRPKVTKGEITIRKVKDSWSREEVENLLESLFRLAVNTNNLNFNKWISENL